MNIDAPVLRPANIILMQVDTINPVNAGKLCHFPTKLDQKITVAVPLTINPKQIIPLWVTGNSLSGDGLDDGDILLVVTNFDLRDITEKTICAVFLIPTGELLAKRVRVNSDGTVSLLSSNPDYPERRVPSEDVEIRGIARAVQKNLY